MGGGVGIIKIIVSGCLGAPYPTHKPQIPQTIAASQQPGLVWPKIQGLSQGV